MPPYSPVSHSLRSATLAGRASELLVLDDRISSAVTGLGSVLLVSGEAGIGKSRLISEACRRFQAAAGGSGMVLQANCFELERDCPYAPVSDLLHRFEMNPPRPGVAARLPKLPEIDHGYDVAFKTAPEKRRVITTLAQFLTGLAREQPLLFVVEDLHWADEATLDLLLHISRGAPEGPLLYIFSYRSDEVSEALQHMLATLDRERRGVELALRPLDRPAVDMMLREMFRQPQPIRTDFLDMIHMLTDGNPFFIEEVVSSLISSGDVYQIGGHWQRKETSELQVPRSVHDAVWRRARDVSTEARQVLAIAAVTGRQFSFRVIQHLTGYEEDQLLACIRELIEQQLVYEESADQFTFRHALTRQTIYTELMTRERRRLHRAVAEAIERMGNGSDEQHLADLAYHYDHAQAWEKSFHFAVQAGDHAHALFAPRATVEHYTRALRAGEYLSIPLNPEIYRKRGQAYITLGQLEPAHADFSRVLEIARKRGDRDMEWQALLDLGSLWTGRDYEHSESFFKRALELARAVNDPALIARSLLQVGNWQANVERVVEAEASLRAALEIFEETGDLRGRAEALDLLGVIADASGDVRAMKQYYGEAAQLYETLGDQKGVVSTLANTAALGSSYVTLETISLRGGVSASEAERTGQRMVELAREIDWRSGEAYALALLGWHCIGQGRYDLALERGRKSLEVSHAIEHHEWLAAGYMVTGDAYAGLLDHKRASSEFEQGVAAARESSSLWLQRLLVGHLAASKVQEGNLERVGQLLAEAQHDLPMNTMGSRLMWSTRAKLELALGQPETALQIVERLFETARNSTAPHDIPALARLRAECLIDLGRYEEAETWLDAARSGAVTYIVRPLLWQVHVSSSALYRATGRPSEAKRALAEARTVVESIAGDLQDEAIRQTFLSNVSLLVPASTARRPEDELTRREMDVAMLVAREMTNREIGDALFIGERTVETHVANILAKRGFTSRRQIAAWVAESDYGEPADHAQ